MDADERSKERVESLKNAIAMSLNQLEGPLDLMEFECEQNEWNDDVCYQIREGCGKLGFALATLTNWFKCVEEQK